MANIELDIVVRGYVTAGGRNEIVNTLKDCYRQFHHQLPYKVEVLITDSEPMMYDYMRQEKFKTGIIDDNLSDTICLHHPRPFFHLLLRQKQNCALNISSQHHAPRLNSKKLCWLHVRHHNDLASN